MNIQNDWVNIHSDGEIVTFPTAAALIEWPKGGHPHMEPFRRLSFLVVVALVMVGCQDREKPISNQIHASAPVGPTDVTGTAVVAEGFSGEAGDEPEREGEGEGSTPKLLWTNSGSACVERSGYPTLEACEADATALTKEAADGELGTACIQGLGGRAVAGPIVLTLTAEQCCGKQEVQCFEK